MLAVLIGGVGDGQGSDTPVESNGLANRKECEMANQVTNATAGAKTGGGERTPRESSAAPPTEGLAPLAAVSARGLAAMMGVSLRHIRRLDCTGKLPKPVRLGRSVRWPVAEIEAWLAAGAPDRRTWKGMKEGRQ